MYVLDERNPIRAVKPGLHGQQTVRKVVVEASEPLTETVRAIIDAKAKGRSLSCSGSAPTATPAA